MATAFITLLIASVYDVRSEKGDVPGEPLYIGIIAGLGLNFVHSMVYGSPAIDWSFTTGLVTAVYGLLAYRQGMWGMADALGITVLGVSTPYLLGVGGLFDLLINVLVIGFAYAVGFGIYQGLKDKDVRAEFKARLNSSKRSIGLIIVVVGVLSGAVSLTGLNPFTVFFLTLSMTFIYMFVETVEDVGMTRTIDADDVEPGDVLAEGEIRGVTQEEIDQLDGKVEVKEGIRFMPVFPASLLLIYAPVSGLELIAVFIQSIQ